MKIRIIALVSMLIVPNFLYAGGPLGSLVDLANTLATGVVTSLGYLMFTVAVVAFLFGMVQFIWAARNGDAGKGVENGKQFMLWGLIALFVMFSVWGIIKFTQGVFNIQGQTTITIPNIQLLGAPAGSSPAGPGGSASDPAKADCPNGPDSACTTKNAAGTTVSGFCNQLSQCVPGRTLGGSGVTTACPNGPRFPCTTKDSSGKTLYGMCSSQGVCDTACSVTLDGVVHTGNYNSSGQCIPDNRNI